MVKRPLVIPTVRVVHVCPPIVVRTNLSDFPAVVQELTGRVNNTTIISRRSSSTINEHFDKFMVSDSGLSSPFMQKSNEEDGSCTLANDSMSAYIKHDHQSNHTKNASSYIDALIIKACSGTIECNNDCCAYKNGTHMVDKLEVWPYEDYWLDGPTDEEVCINEAESVVSSCNDLSSPNWTTTTSMSNYKREEDSMECLANACRSSGRQLSELVIYPESTAARTSERRPVKKTKLIHHASPESHLHHQHLISSIILNSMDCFPPNYEENIAGSITPHSSPFPSDNDLEYLHADSYHHILLQKFEESSTEVLPFSII